MKTHMMDRKRFKTVEAGGEKYRLYYSMCGILNPKAQAWGEYEEYYLCKNCLLAINKRMKEVAK